MMTEVTMGAVDRADRMARMRATLSIIIGVAILATMGIHLLAFSTWLTAIWMADLLLGLAMILHIGFFRHDAVGRLVDDEASGVNRGRALAAGFWAGMVTIALAFVTTLYATPSSDTLLRVITSVMIAVALLRFGLLERRALA